MSEEYHFGGLLGDFTGGANQPMWGQIEPNTGKN